MLANFLESLYAVNYSNVRIRCFQCVLASSRN